MFETLGMKSYHWRYNNEYIGTKILKNKMNGDKLLKGFENVDCITQMDVCISHEHCYWPQISDYAQIYDENKDAIFILNIRNPYNVLSSFKRWGKYNERLNMYNPEILGSTDDQSFINFVIQHYNNVIDFYSSKPCKFLVYDIENDDITKLKNILILKI